ncbi:MAG: hypothetical protein KDA99_00620, partial [Planctomycetales bacterium]|nr:hypothetical protein [Planctomycetales bacterium]
MPNDDSAWGVNGGGVGNSAGNGATGGALLDLFCKNPGGWRWLFGASEKGVYDGSDSSLGESAFGGCGRPLRVPSAVLRGDPACPAKPGFVRTTDGGPPSAGPPDAVAGDVADGIAASDNCPSLGPVFVSKTCRWTTVEFPLRSDICAR